MGLVDHAKTEIELMDWTDDKEIYHGMLSKAVMELIEVFARQGHSGASAWAVREVFYRLSKFENLSQVTLYDFVEVSRDIWQCKRNSALFLNKEKTGYYSVNDSEKKITLF